MDRLTRFVFKSGLVMKPLVAAAKADVKRVIYADGEDERVLRAAQAVIEDGLASPILVGRPSVIATRLKRFGLKIRPDADFEVINPDDDPRYRDYVDLFLEKAGRRGVTPDAARTIVRTNTTAIAALAVERGEADAMLCGLEGQFQSHFKVIREIIGLRPGSSRFSAMSLLISSESTTFLTDTYVNVDPTAEEIAELTCLAADQVRRFGIVPKAALLSHSNFGSHDTPSSRKMRQAVERLWEMAPELEVDGEMHGDAALSEALRQRAMPKSRLTGDANLLVFPNIDAANITLNVVKVMTDALHVGPILLGAAKPAHILTPSVTSRGVANMTTLAAVEAQSP
jgi:malate dehydrogenase (oxaloacetate-decarboxylating)(NADP+)